MLIYPLKLGSVARHTVLECPLHSQVPANTIQMCKFSHLECGDPIPYHELGRDKLGFGNFHSYADSCVSAVLKVWREGRVR